MKRVELKQSLSHVCVCVRLMIQLLLTAEFVKAFRFLFFLVDMFLVN